MKCPHCPDATLVMSERQGVEIDYCPSCRGVWLDRGELDKLIERSAALEAPRAAAPAATMASPRRPDFVDSDYGRHQQHPHQRRKSWLSDIFD
jgi:Zn-finger nucleic acid-binding protein